MIRFILKRKRKNDPGSVGSESFVTFLADVPELETRLTCGGESQHGYDLTELVGVEVINEPR